MSAQRSLKKQLAQANLNNQNVYLDESLNISKLPFLLVTPEKVRINRTSTLNNRHREIPLQLETSPIDTSERRSETISIVEYSSQCTDDYSDNAFANLLYFSPVSNRTSIESFTLLSHTLHGESFNSVAESEKFYTVNGSFFDNELQQDTQMYACCHTFHATDADQLSLQISDKVRIVYSKGDQCLVQHVASGKRGFVPSSVISSLNQPWINKKSINL